MAASTWAGNGPAADTFTRKRPGLDTPSTAAHGRGAAVYSMAAHLQHHARRTTCNVMRRGLPEVAAGAGSLHSRCPRTPDLSMRDPLVVDAQTRGWWDRRRDPVFHIPRGRSQKQGRNSATAAPRGLANHSSDDRAADDDDRAVTGTTLREGPRPAASPFAKIDRDFTGYASAADCLR